MLKVTKKLLSLGLVLAMLLMLIPAGTVAIAAGESDATLSQLSYTFEGETQGITLIPDTLDSSKQENRYSQTLPYITKTFTSDRMPQVSAVSTYGGVVTYGQISSFPGTAKITVTSVDTTTTREYYVRFNYEPGNITSPITNNMSSQIYLAHNDLQPMSLRELSKLYTDELSNWVNYCQSYMDRYIIGFNDTDTNTQKLPSAAATVYTGTGEYLNDYIGATGKWATMWIGQNTKNGSTSSFFNGASWIATGNDDKATAYMVAAHDDAITFTTDRGATVYVASLKSTATNFQLYGWTTDTSGYKVYHGDGTAFATIFKKHFEAGEVKIPSQGVSVTKMYIPIIVWDAPGSGNTELSSLKATYGGQEHDIPVVQGQTTYNIEVPSVPEISAQLTDADAEIDVVQSAQVPGTATITVLSGANTSVYTINYTLAAGESDTTLSQLSYTFEGETHDMILTADDVNSALQENRYIESLPLITKTFTSDRMPQVSAVSTYGGAVIYEQTTSFPGTAKITVTSVDTTASKEYYLRFNYEAGNISALTNNMSATTYLAHNDLQPMSLRELSKLYTDEESNWVNYCQSYVDRYITGFNDTDTSIQKLPSAAATVYTGTGEYLNDYIGATGKWATMWIGQNTLNGSTSSFFNGASWIATGNDDKATDYMKAAHDDAITFTTDRGATVWVASKNATEGNFIANGWSKDTSGYKIFHGDGSSFLNIFKKHFDSGEVKIPTLGASVERMYIPIIVWDAPGSGNTELSSLKATCGGQEHDIPVVQGQTTYNINVPSVPEISAQLTDADAEMDVVQSAQVPGTATITVLSGANTAVYTINYTMVMYGDISGDGIIDISDVIMAAEIAVGYPGYSNDQIIAANVSSKTDLTVDISDVVMIAERAVGVTPPFPVEENEI